MSADSVLQERFELLGELGEGGMGVVYRAYDRRRRHEVALKMLRQLDGARVFRFKQEFRSLAGLVHRNLVTLYELVADGDAWMFSMELLDGVPFIEHVRPHEHLVARSAPVGLAATMAAPAGRIVAAAAASPSVTSATCNASPARAAALESARAVREALEAARLDELRLRASALQLAESVQVLHRAGKLHRDLKPSNVLVEPSGRVVVCDFGLVMELDASAHDDAVRAWGTPRYMSPEQAGGLPQGEASDWYSFGVMLHEALLGRAPFEGLPHEVRERKRQEAADVSALAGSELGELVAGLLEREPERRPGGDDVVRRLRSIAGERQVVWSLPGLARIVEPEVTQRAPFVGREDELAQLRQAFVDARQRCVSVLVHGRSGLGKSALVRHFLDEVAAADPQVVVLSGRCYERESVPHSTLDGLVDALSSVLVAMPEEELAPLVPRDHASLVRVFPVLRRVAALDEPDPSVPSDPQELRARAFGALRVLLTRFATRRPTVIFLDDLQWGDVGSGKFLLRLVHHPSAPSLLFAGTYREEDVETSPLAQLLASAGRSGPGDVRYLPVAPLSEGAARSLARTLLGDADAAAAERIVGEASGNPFFLAELVRAAGQGEAAGADEGGSRLASLVRGRWQRLDAPARRFLAAAALAGRPLPTEVLCRAGDIDDEPAVLALLRAESLVRTRRAGDVEEVETFHDRIREVVAAALPEDERRELHLHLAQALDARGGVDPEVLLEHWLGAGKREHARRAAIAAAQLAEGTFAFDRAARLYQLVVELASDDDAERPRWLERLGDCLTYAGNLSGASEAYLAAAERQRDASDLRRRAFDALLCSGQVDRGLEVANQVVGSFGLGVPRSQRAALAAVAFEKLRLAVRGARFRALPAEARDPALLRRIDMCRSLASGFGFIQPVSGTLFHHKQLRLALDSGDPWRVAMAFIYQMAVVAVAGGPSRAHVERVTATIRALPEFDEGSPIGGYLFATLGLAAFLRGEFADATTLIERGERAMALDTPTFRWQIDLSKIYRMAALGYAGRIGELTFVTPLLLREAIESGNELSALGLRSWRSNLTWLAMDAAGEARAHADSIAPLTRHGEFHLYHYFELLSQTQVDLYLGDAEGAWRRLEGTWPRLEKALLLRMQMARVESAFLRARCALAMAAARPAEAARFVGEAELQGKRIAHERMPWSDAIAALLAGLVAAARREHAPATSLLGEAATRLDAAGMALHAQVARLRAGQEQGDADGDARAALALEWMRGENIVAPERFATLYAPVPPPRRVGGRAGAAPR